MPKLSKNKKKVIGELLQETGCSKAMNGALLRAAGAETKREGIAADRELQRVLLEDLKRQIKEGARFDKADLQELLGQDRIPHEFQEVVRFSESLPKPAPKGPGIAFDAPTGWSAERGKFTLNIKKGRKTLGVISVIDSSTFDRRLKKNEIRERSLNRNLDPASGNVGWAKSPMRSGDAHGYKYLYIQTEPFWKSIEYLLEVPGGKVGVTLGGGGRDFDETTFEEQLKTVRVSSEG
jgi:hypothetical protein